ncbi:MAG: hypothetical protein ACRD01_05745 [Terriglobales bacterium]
MGRRNQSAAVWMMSGIAIGVGVGWLTAPRRGDWLRNQIEQKLIRWRKRGLRRLYKRGRDLQNRVWGSVAEVKEMWAGREHYVDANTLVDQVRSELGRAFAATLARVNLNAIGHTIYLHGCVESGAERDELTAAISAIEGVEAVDASRLQVPAESNPAGEPRPAHADESAAPEPAGFQPTSDARESSAPAAAQPRSRRPRRSVS